jgi:hypothetical protein
MDSIKSYELKHDSVLRHSLLRVRSLHQRCCRRGYRWNGIFLILASCGIFFRSDCTVFADEPFPRSKVLKQMQYWRSNCVNFSIKWRHSSPTELLKNDPNLTTDELQGNYALCEFFWDITNSSRTDSAVFKAGKSTGSQSWRVSTVDSIKSYQTFSIKDGKKTDSRIEIGDLNTAHPSISVLPLTGWMFPAGKRFLVDELELPENLPVDPNSGMPFLNFNEHKIVLDPDHGFLVKKVEKSAPGLCFEVHEYALVGDNLWLPIEGTYRLIRDGFDDWVMNWHVIDYKFNEVFEDVFSPPTPDKGDVVDDKISGKTYRHAFSQWDRLEEIATIAKQGARSWENSALPARPLHWWIVRASVLLLLVTVGATSLFYLFRCVLDQRIKKEPRDEIAKC